MTPAKALSLLLPILLLCLGCGEGAPPPTLVIHVHDGVFDLIDHSGTIVRTVDDFDAVNTALDDPNTTKLVGGDRVVIRFKGVRQPGGALVPSDEAIDLCTILLQRGITHCHFDYTNQEP